MMVWNRAREVKKYLLLLIVTVIVFLPCDCCAIDTVNRIILDCGKKVNVGDNIICEVSANFSTFVVSGISAKFDFSSNLEYVSFVHESSFVTYYESGNGFVLLSANANLKGNIKLGTLTLKLTKDVAVGQNCTVELSDVVASDNSEEYISKTLDSVKSTIKVVQKDSGEQDRPEDSPGGDNEDKPGVGGSSDEDDEGEMEDSTGGDNKDEFEDFIDDDKDQEEDLFNESINNIILLIISILSMVLIGFIVKKINRKFRKEV